MYLPVIKLGSISLSFNWLSSIPKLDFQHLLFAIHESISDEQEQLAHIIVWEREFNSRQHTIFRLSIHCVLLESLLP